MLAFTALLYARSTDQCFFPVLVLHHQRIRFAFSAQLKNCKNSSVVWERRRWWNKFRVPCKQSLGTEFTKSTPLKREVACFSDGGRHFQVLLILFPKNKSKFHYCSISDSLYLPCPLTLGSSPQAHNPSFPYLYISQYFISGSFLIQHETSYLVTGCEAGKARAKLWHELV